MATLVTLEPWEYEWASHVGTRRFIENWERRNARHYDPARMEDDRTAQVAACVCEIAVAKATNRYWSGHVWAAGDHHKYKAIADVGRRIEVRRVRTGTRAAVRRHQVGQGLFLFPAQPVMPELRAINLLGWIKYDKAWELGVPSSFDPANTRLIDVDHLGDVSVFVSQVDCASARPVSASPTADCTA